MDICVYNIDWDTTDEDGNIQDIELPDELTFNLNSRIIKFTYDELADFNYDDLVDNIADKLSDYYGFYVNDLDVEFELKKKIVKL